MSYFNTGVVTESAGAVSDIYLCPAANKAIVTCNLVNRLAAPAQISLGIGTAAATQAAASYIEIQLLLAAKATYERTGIILTSGQYLNVMCSAASGIVARAWGKAEAA